MGKNESNKLYKEITKNKRKLLLGSNTLVIIFKPVFSEDIKRATNLEVLNETKNISPWKLFEMLIDANKLIVKGLKLHNSLKELQLCGWISPYTLFLCGLFEDIKVVKNSWVKRMMRSPLGFYIKELGFVQDFYVESIPQSLFLSLATALFETIVDLNQQNIYPNKDTLHDYLKKKYSDIVIPDSKSIHECLRKLVCEKRLYHNGRGYFVLKDDSFLNKFTSSNSSVKRIPINANSPPQIELDFSQKNGKTKPDIDAFTKNVSKHKDLQLDDKNIGIMNFLTRIESFKSKTTQAKINYTDKNDNLHSFKTNTSKNEVFSGSGYYEQSNHLNYIENENFKYKKKKRSNSFHGTDSEKSFEKSVSFAIVGCKNEKTDTTFKRHHSFGAGSHSILQTSQNLVNEQTKDTVEVKEKTQETVVVKDVDVCKNYYDDLGSALSLSNQPVIDAVIIPHVCSFKNELSLADEMKIAEKDINFSNEKSHKIDCNSKQLVVIEKKNRALSATSFLPPQVASDASRDLTKQSTSSGNFNLATFSDNLVTNSDIKQLILSSSNEERKQIQKERNSILFAEKKGTLRVVGFV
ncbi:uncharacterized protein LOC101239572 [Hydra vulgaris]|uniref:uncharacterized protein LOC101239572 n=1 Tax=Hydra vulgaris TaxID=6087 RepID=UPI001F5E57FF|nr:uncharacterized protein LOC101239572 [Hydra vulgaris]